MDIYFFPWLWNFEIFPEYFPLLPACPSLVPRPSPILEAERAANIHRKPTMSERRALFGPNKANNLSFLIKGSVEFGASGVGVRKRQRQLDLAAFYPFLLPLTPRGLLTPEDQLPFPSLCERKGLWRRHWNRSKCLDSCLWPWYWVSSKNAALSLQLYHFNCAQCHLRCLLKKTATSICTTSCGFEKLAIFRNLWVWYLGNTAVGIVDPRLCLPTYASPTPDLSAPHGLESL